MLQKLATTIGLSVALLAPAALRAQQGPRPPLQDPTHETTTADVPGLTAASSLCAISDDATYGTETNPVKVGGGPLYMASREVKYLSALRGPTGQGLHFKRGGSARGPDPATVVDVYSVDYPGIGQPVRIYIDPYHWAEPRAPKGWLCGAAMNLNPPGPDPFETQKQLRTLAVRLGERDVEPISLDPDGSKAHGVVFDHVRRIALGARAAVAAGKPLNPEALPRELNAPSLVVVAFPMTCDGQSIAPTSVTLTDSNNNSPPAVEKAKGSRLAELLPGFKSPDGAIAVVYNTASLIDGARAVVVYAGSCGSTLPTVVLPVKSERARVVKFVNGVAPPGMPPPQAGTVVRVQVFLDADGTPWFPVYASGPWELADVAIGAVKEWRVEPPKMNGAPIFQTSILGIAFR